MDLQKHNEPETSTLQHVLTLAGIMLFVALLFYESWS
jgi:hypothetical protein